MSDGIDDSRGVSDGVEDSRGVLDGVNDSRDVSCGVSDGAHKVSDVSLGFKEDFAVSDGSKESFRGHCGGKHGVEDGTRFSGGQLGTRDGSATCTQRGAPVGTPESVDGVLEPSASPATELSAPTAILVNDGIDIGARGASWVSDDGQDVISLVSLASMDESCLDSLAVSAPNSHMFQAAPTTISAAQLDSGDNPASVAGSSSLESIVLSLGALDGLSAEFLRTACEASMEQESSVFGVLTPLEHFKIESSADRFDNLHLSDVFGQVAASLDEEIASLRGATFWETSKEFHCPSTAPSGLPSSPSHGDQTEAEQSGSSNGDVDGFAAVGLDVASIGVLDGGKEGHEAVSLGSSDGLQKSIDLQHSGDSEGAMDSPVNSGHCPSVVASSGLSGGTADGSSAVLCGVIDGMVDGLDSASSGAASGDAGDEQGAFSSATFRISSKGETLPTKDQLKSPPKHPSKAKGEFRPLPVEPPRQSHFLPESQQQIPVFKISQRHTANILASGSWAEVPSDDFFIGSLDSTFACAPNPVTSRGFIFGSCSSVFRSIGYLKTSFISAL